MAVFESPVESLESGGGGVVNLSGERYFALQSTSRLFICPGDIVEAELIDKKKRAVRVLRILQESPDRAKPRCYLFGICGGCSLQHIAYERQLSEKKSIIKNLFYRTGGFKTLPDIKVVPSFPYNYRNRLELHTDGKRAGLKRFHSAEIVETVECPAAVGEVNDFLRYLSMPDGKALLKKLPPRWTVYGCEDGLVYETGKPSQLLIKPLGVIMEVGWFFQSNLSAQKVLINDLKAAAGQGGSLLDIYCGVGVFAHALSAQFEKITLLEENHKALALARENMRTTNRPAVYSAADYIALPAEKWAAQAQSGVPHWDVVIADPPREGLPPPVITLFNKGRAIDGRLLYVSCNPVSLARDSALLCKGGWTLSALTFYDFYPQTAHIECLAVFQGG